MTKKLSIFNAYIDFFNLKLSNFRGNIPDNIKEIKINENKIIITELLSKIGFASSKGEAKRMIQGKGVKIDGKNIDNINLVVEIKESVIIQFGKNKFIKVIYQ